MNVPPWVVETDAPISWLLRIPACIRADNLAQEWADKGW